MEPVDGPEILEDGTAVYPTVSAEPLPAHEPAES